MPDLPTGTVTFLFTDIEGSTRLLRDLGEGYRAVQDAQMRIMREAIASGGGREIRTEGDSFFVAFPSAQGAVEAAVAAQRALHAHAWSHGKELRVRMGMHTGEGRLGGDDYLGIDVNRAARIAAAGHGGQVLLSDPTRALVANALPEGVKLKSLGRHRLKDFDEPQPVLQLVIEGLPGDFPPLKTLETPTNLPVQLTSFVGREAELAALETLLATSRLITLAGPGGTGKTRLALEVAARSMEGHGGGVYFVDLSPIRDPGLVPSAVLQALGVKEEPGQPPMRLVADHLAERRSLIILDNFERVVPAAVHVEEMLRAAPRTTLLVTSRIRLDLLGEQEFPVPPLGVPTDAEDMEALAGNDAVALFRDRALAVRPSFEITDDNARTIAEICNRVEGLPLAIELAAAQLRVLSPSELLARLERRLPLRTDAANVPERQRTLRSTIEWSYDLLDAPLQRFFARLAVFARGATLAGIEAVCTPNGAGLDTVDALASLVDHSLIRRDDVPSGSRFVMLETIREYAAERLEADFDLQESEHRHAKFFADLCEEWGPWIRSPRGAEATPILERDYENVRAAVAWALRTDRADVGLRIAASMWMFWVEHGPLAEGRQAVKALLSLPSAAPRDALRVRALEALGALTYWEGDYAAAERAYGEALDISRETGDVRGSGEACKNLAYVAGAAGESAKARSMAEEARRIAKAAGLRALDADAAGILGLAHSREGDHHRALVATQEALEGFEAEGIFYWANEMKARMGSMYLRMGRLDEAEAYLRTSMEATRLFPSAVAKGAAMQLLAAVAAARGAHERALRLTGFAEALSERMGNSPPAALLGESAAYLAASRSALDPQTVERLLAEGRAMDDDEAVTYALEER